MFWLKYYILVTAFVFNLGYMTGKMSDGKIERFQFETSCLIDHQAKREVGPKCQAHLDELEKRERETKNRGTNRIPASDSL